jgi:dienelactone hydrolase
MIQGGADKITPPVLTKRFARRLCAAGETVELRLYPAAEHGEAGIVASPDVAAWIAGRFAGAAAPSTCQTNPGG